MSDLISKRELYHKLGEAYNAGLLNWGANEIVKDIIGECLSFENRGEWIELPKALNHSENPCECSNCKHILSFMNGYPKSNFCPNCGADMRGEADGKT